MIRTVVDRRGERRGEGREGMSNKTDRSYRSDDMYLTGSERRRTFENVTNTETDLTSRGLDTCRTRVSSKTSC